MKLSKLDIFLPLIGGFIAGLSAPGFNQWIFAWIGFIPLFYTISRQSNPLNAVFCSFSFGLAYHIVYLVWFLGLHPLYWLGFNYFQSLLLVFLVYYSLVCLQSIYISIFGLFVYYILKLPVGKAFLIAFAWVFCVNFLSSQGIFAFPWALIEYSQYLNIGLLQLSPIIGGVGIGFLIILFNAFACFSIISIEKTMKIMIDEAESFKFKAKSILNVFKSLKVQKNILSLLILTLFIIFISNVRLAEKSNNAFGELTACAVQADIPIEAYKTNKINIFTEHRIYSALISQCPDESLIVLPEGAYSTYLRSKKHYKIIQDLQKLSFRKQSTIIVGTTDKNDLGYTNAIISINPNESRLTSSNIYNKNHLVPFGEFVPFREILPNIIEGLASVSSSRDFSAGKTLNPVSSKFGQIGTGICFEVLFPQISNTVVKNGAVILVNGSNLGWYHSSMIDTQFIAISAFRAAETNRPLIVAINNGSSAIINQKGEIIKKSEKNKTMLINAKIIPSTDFTFFTK